MVAITDCRHHCGHLDVRILFQLSQAAYFTYRAEILSKTALTIRGGEVDSAWDEGRIGGGTTVMLCCGDVVML